MTTAKLCADRLVGGRYALEALIGRGGMGEVWRARHVALKTLVAIKFLQGAVEPSERAKRRFLTEAQVTANLKTRHAVQVFDFGVTDDARPFLVMELLLGETLDKRIARAGRLSLAITSLVLQKAARALERAHALGIVHRDFKPENIMLVADEEDGGELVKVVDFGIAKLVGDLDSTLKTALSSLAQARRPPSAPVLDVTSSAVGTPYYMAPEQVEDSAQIGPATDIWAFGVVAYECLTGRRPFDDESVGKLMLRVLAAAPPTPASSFAPVPALFDDWFRVACARDPRARFPDVQTAASALALSLDTAILAGPPQLVPIESRATPKPSLAAHDAAPTLSSLRAAAPAAVLSPDQPLPAPLLLPASLSPLAETLAPLPFHGAVAEGPPDLRARPSALTSAPALLRVSRSLRALPALSALAAAALAILLAGRDAPGRARAPVTLVRATTIAPAALPPIDALLVSPAPVLIDPVIATSCSPPAPPALPSAAPPARRRPSQAVPSVYRLPPLGL